MPLGYAFVSFDDRSMAEHVLQQVNGKQIPNITNEVSSTLRKIFLLMDSNCLKNLGQTILPETCHKKWTILGLCWQSTASN